ncbi:hypothetical protein [Flammeovirga sp. SJP92]|uniref:hypothetical protein n=1 Tax=Flammeovirga sp. SJP92 TaxID=1775430 RepID=UPI000788C636|nr:hypothetical protein [Flammeovirga sp. SJP92]KXX72396.1 hypothetical protein AVL50_01995 [Flammeovirga sp. SJP92]
MKTKLITTVLLLISSFTLGQNTIVIQYDSLYSNDFFDPMIWKLIGGETVSGHDFKFESNSNFEGDFPATYHSATLNSTIKNLQFASVFNDTISVAYHSNLHEMNFTAMKYFYKPIEENTFLSDKIQHVDTINIHIRVTGCFHSSEKGIGLVIDFENDTILKIDRKKQTERQVSINLLKSIKYIEKHKGDNCGSTSSQTIYLELNHEILTIRCDVCEEKFEKVLAEIIN